MTRTEDVVLRPATTAEAGAMAEVHVAARRAAPGMPPMRHDLPTTQRWVRDRLDRGSAAWVAVVDDRVVGYLVLTDDWLDDLYVVPASACQGIGTALLDVVKAHRPDGFSLWVFESNAAARSFYAGRGLVELERTDGADNEEQAPDVRLVWPGAAPLAFLRRQVDEVDDDLGRLLARRAALTRVIQRHKSGGDRDPAREREVVDRVAASVPELGEQRVARIVDVVITESLGAVEEG